MNLNEYLIHRRKKLGTTVDNLTQEECEVMQFSHPLEKGWKSNIQREISHDDLARLNDILAKQKSLIDQYSKKKTPAPAAKQQPVAAKVNVDVYTNGTCNSRHGKNPNNTGGWGALLKSAEKEREIFGGEKNTTLYRMELTAVVVALETLLCACNVTIHANSKYIQDGVNIWMSEWKQRDWRAASGKPIKNLDLWIRLDEVIKKHNITWVHSQDEIAAPN